MGKEVYAPIFLSDRQNGWGARVIAVTEDLSQKNCPGMISGEDG